MKTLVCLALCLLPLNFFGAGDARNAALDLVTKTYSLDAVLPDRHTANEYSEVLAPFFIRYPDNAASPYFGSEQLQDSVAEIVMRLFERELAYEGRQIDYGGGRLRVVAPAPVQAEIQRLLAFLEGAFRRSVDLRIDVLERPADAPALAGFLGAKEADELLAAAGQRTQSHVLRAQPGRIAVLDATRELTLVTDYDVEIAQLAAQTDPVITHVSLGLRVSARTAIVPGGVRAALILRNATQVGDVRERHVDLGAMITVDTGPRAVTNSVALQSVAVLQRGLALNLSVPDGQVAVIETSLAVQTGASRLAFLVRATAEKREPYAALTLSGDSGRVEVADLSYVAPPVARIQGRLFDQEGSGSSLKELFAVGDPNSSGDAAAIALLELGETSWIEERASSEMHEQVSLSPWLVMFALKSDPTAKLPAVALGPDSSAFAQATPPESVSLALTLRRSGANGAVLARATLPVVLGERSAVVLGGEQLYVADADVEVAQGAITIDPVVVDAFDGLACAILPMRANDGALVVDLCARASVLDGPLVPMVVGAPLSIECERPTDDGLVANERLVFATGNAQRRVTLLGSRLVLDVELR